MPGLAIPIIGAAVGAAGSVAGAGIASHAQTNAKNAQLTAATKAQGAITNAYNTGRQTLGQVYGQQQANLSPYQALGTAALGSLGSKMGIAPPGTVAVKAPNGQVYHLPQAVAQQAISQGGGVPL